MLLDTLPAPSADGVDKVYHQLKDILGTTAMQQAESSLQCRPEVSILSLDRSKFSQQKVAMELLVLGTAPSLTQILSRVRLCHPSRHPELMARHQVCRRDEGAQSEHHERNPH
jgi:hypothetical protein